MYRFLSGLVTGLFLLLSPIFVSAQVTDTAVACPNGYDYYAGGCFKNDPPIDQCPGNRFLTEDKQFCTEVGEFELDCQPGYALLDGNCFNNIPSTRRIRYSCSGGRILTPDNRYCTSVRNPSYSCPAGYSRSGTTCRRNESISATPNTRYECPPGRVLTPNQQNCSSVRSPTPGTTNCPANYVYYLGNCYNNIPSTPVTSYSCPTGYSLSNTSCNRTLTVAATASCQGGYNLYQGSCFNNIASTQTPYYECDDNRVLTPNQLNCTAVTDPIITNDCEPGFVEFEGACFNNISSDGHIGCPAGTTLTSDKQNCYAQELVTELTVSWDMEEIIEDDSATFSWSATNAEGCEDDMNAGIPASGSLTETLSTSKTRSVTCGVPQGQSVVAQVAIDVVPRTTVNAYWQPAQIEEGESSTLFWESENAISCTGNTGNPVALTDSSPEYPPATATYTITCEGLAGQVVQGQALITVTSPGSQLEDGVYVGHLSQDGQHDFYVHQASTPVSDVGSFILENDANGTTIRSPLTPSQLAEVRNWQRVAVDLIPADLNADGKIDLMIDGIEGLNVGGATVTEFDQIVFAAAPGASQVPTSAALTPVLKKFFNEIFSWMLNPSFFQENADPITQTYERFPTGSLEIYGDSNPANSGAVLDQCEREYTWCTEWGYKPLGLILSSAQCLDYRLETNFTCLDTSRYRVVGSNTVAFNVEVIVGYDYSAFYQEAMDAALALGPIYGDESIAEVNPAAVSQLEQVLEILLDTSIGLNSGILYAETLPVELPVQFGLWPAYDPTTAENLPDTVPAKVGILGRIISTIGWYVYAAVMGPEEAERLQEIVVSQYGHRAALDKAREWVGIAETRAMIGEEQLRVDVAALEYAAMTASMVWPTALEQKDGEFSPELEELALAFNKGWIAGVMAARFDILDIGRPVTRVGLAVSKFYRLERLMIIAYVYPKRIPIAYTDTVNWNYY